MSLFLELSRLTNGHVKKDLSLADISYWKIGGRVSFLVTPQSLQQLEDVVRHFNRIGYPYLIVGNTTNILFSDDGVDGAIIQTNHALSSVKIDSESGSVVAQAGVWTPCLARRIAAAGLVGAEHLVGIPGSLGGIVVMNGGSKQKSISENIVSVESLDSSSSYHLRSKEACGFSYRHSVFQENDDVVTTINLMFKSQGNPNSIRKDMLAILTERRRKFPLRLPSCGSVFMADKSQFDAYGAPGAVVESLGLKGFAIGGAEISRLHANFIVNNGGAKAADVLALVGLVRATARKAGINYKLESEIKYVSSDSHIIPLHLASELVNEV